MGPTKHSCIFCDKVFVGMGHLEAHMRSHTGEKPFFCEDCDKCYAGKYNLGSHIINFHHKKIPKGKDKPFQCDLCEKAYSLRGNLRKHMRLVHEVKLRKMEKQKLFSCELCENTFGYWSSLKTHMLHFHKQLPKAELNKKMRSKSVPCQVCKITFFNRSSMLRHMRHIHNGRLPKKKVSIACKYCSVTLSSNTILRKHMQRLHKEILYAEPGDLQNGADSCEPVDPQNGADSCEPVDLQDVADSSEPVDPQNGADSSEPVDPLNGADYSEPVDLQDVAVSSEHGELNKKKEGKSFSCEFCEKAYTYRDGLKKHMRRFHKDLLHAMPSDARKKKKNELVTCQPGEFKNKLKSVTCEQCEMTFNLRASMIRHLLTIHNQLPRVKPKKTKSKLVPCEVCNKPLFNRTAMLKHMRDIHKVLPKVQQEQRKPVPCELCEMTFNSRKSMAAHMRYFHGQSPTVPPSKSTKYESVPCELCNKTFFDKYCMKKHVRLIHQQELKGYLKRRPPVKLGKGKCTYCGLAFFKRYSVLLLHQSRCPRRNDYKCDHCVEVFHEKTLYLDHIRSFCPKRSIGYKCLLCSSWEGNDPLNVLEHAIKCKPTGKLTSYSCDVCCHRFYRKTVAYHIQYELLHSRLFKDIPCDFKCASCEVSFPTQVLLSLHQELEHPCLLHKVGLEDLDGFTVDSDKKEALMDERQRVRDLDPKKLEFKGLKPKHRCHVCLYPFHCSTIQVVHGKYCERKYGVTRIEERRQQEGDFFPRRREKPLHINLTTGLKHRLFTRLILDMNVNKKLVRQQDYCDEIEREFSIARGLFRKWIPELLKDNKDALEFYNTNLYNEDISLIEVVSKAAPVLIDLSKEASPALQVPPTSIQCQSCHAVCASEDELHFHMDSATKYFRKKHNALLNMKKKVTKVRTTFPTNPKYYDNLEPWRFNDKLPKHFCYKCGRPFHSKIICVLHTEFCKAEPESPDGPESPRQVEEVYEEDSDEEDSEDVKEDKEDEEVSEEDDDSEDEKADIEEEKDEEDSEGEKDEEDSEIEKDEEDSEGEKDEEDSEIEKDEEDSEGEKDEEDSEGEKDEEDEEEETEDDDSEEEEDSEKEKEDNEGEPCPTSPKRLRLGVVEKKKEQQQERKQEPRPLSPKEPTLGLVRWK